MEPPYPLVSEGPVSVLCPAGDLLAHKQPDGARQSQDSSAYTLAASEP